MTVEYRQQTWDDRLRGTNFPFASDKPLVSNNGRLTIPTGAFTDAMVGGPVLSSPIYIRSVVITTSSLTFVFAQGSTDVSSVSITKATPTGWLNLQGGTQFRGRVLVDMTVMAALFNVPANTYRFTEAVSALVPSATFYQPSGGLNGFSVGGVSVQGDILIIAGRGFQFKQVGDAIQLHCVGNSRRDVRGDDDELLRALKKLIVVQDDTTVELQSVSGKIKLQERLIDENGVQLSKTSALRFRKSGDGTVTLEVMR